MTTEVETGHTTDNGRWVVRKPADHQRGKVEQGRRDRALRVALGLVIPVAMIVSWELSAQLNLIDVRFFSHPLGVVQRAVHDINDGLWWSETWITTVRLLVGYVVGSVAGIIVGLMMSQSKKLRWLLEPIIRGLYVIPKLALLPLFLLLFGIGELPKLVFVALGTFYIVAFTTLSAATLIPTAFHEVARSYGLSRPQSFRWLIVPAAMPQIASSLRLASGISILLVIAVEFVQAQEGIGYYTWHAWQLFIPDRMYVGVLTVSILGLLFNTLIGALCSRMVRWTDGEYDQQR